MIVFDLDGTLADCEHRRHLVDISYNKDVKSWKPDWDSFFKSCDKDTPIQPVVDLWDQQISLGMMGVHEIWSGRCESVREKTEQWLNYHLLCFNSNQLKMRPIGDFTPDDILKERWLNQRCSDLITAQMEGYVPQKHGIDFVVDDRPKVVRMWRRRNIFVFDVNQSASEF